MDEHDRLKIPIITHENKAGKEQSGKIKSNVKELISTSEGSTSDLEHTQNENKIINTSIINCSGNIWFLKLGLYFTTMLCYDCK